MYLRALELNEFRSFRKLVLPVEPSGFRAIGPNASGKSTLLEAMAMLATTRSPRTSSERELLHWESGRDLAVPPYARLRGDFSRLDGEHRVEIGLSVDERGGPLRKQIRLDGRPVRAVDAVGQLKTVLFSPNDVDLIAGPPSNRRRYLDVALSQGNRSYLAALSRFGRVLEQRNSLLRTLLRESSGYRSIGARDQLLFWDSELTAAATDVLAFRLVAAADWTTRARMYFEMLTGIDSLLISYAPARLVLPFVPAGVQLWSAPEQPLRQEISAAFASSLEAAQADEMRRGVTAVGPHRDDFVVSSDGVDLGTFGSRGQQRLAVIAIKLAELDLLERAAGETPVLLLDDILSELDGVHRRRIVGLLGVRKAQICVTATDEADLQARELGHLSVLRLNFGAIDCDPAQ